MAQRFPVLFERGDLDQCLENQIWGHFENTNYYQAVFRFKSDQKNAQPIEHVREIVAIQIPTLFRDTLILYPESTVNQWMSSLGNACDVEVESEEFNYTFKISGSPHADSQKLKKLFKILTPSTQLQLVKLAQSFKGAAILISGDCLMMVLNPYYEDQKDGYQIPGKTNFRYRSRIHPLDIERYGERTFKRLQALKSFKTHLMR